LRDPLVASGYTAHRNEDNHGDQVACPQADLVGQVRCPGFGVEFDSRCAQQFFGVISDAFRAVTDPKCP
jgi:hypothetical protein